MKLQPLPLKLSEVGHGNSFINERFGLGTLDALTITLQMFGTTVAEKRLCHRSTLFITIYLLSSTSRYGPRRSEDIDIVMIDSLLVLAKTSGLH